MEQDHVRPVEPDDYQRIVAVANTWWGQQFPSDMLTPVFMSHFHETCLVAEDSGELVGFLVGFLSQSRPDEAYIRVIMIHPERRGAGVGRTLYEAFFGVVEAYGRSIIRAVTSPANAASLAFHRNLGFEIEPGDSTIAGVPVANNYDGRGAKRVRFICNLSQIRKGSRLSIMEGN